MFETLGLLASLAVAVLTGETAYGQAVFAAFVALEVVLHRQFD